MPTQPNERVARLEALDREAASIREELAVSPPGAILYSAFVYAVEDDLVVVEADGLGKAVTMVVEGNYPVDFSIRYYKDFGGEAQALDAAREIVEDGLSPSDVLGDY